MIISNVKSNAIIIAMGCFLLLTFLGLFFSCSSDKPGADVAEIIVDFSWDIKDMDTSPELALKNVPQATSYFKVEMFDLDNRVHHGSSQINNDNSNKIRAGAIESYQAPQPIFGSPKYEFIVKAYDQDGKLTGMGKKIRKFPEE